MSGLTIVAGTGRFADAQGAGHLSGTIQFPGLQVAAWPAQFSLDGWITY